ncbi:hypothetical protein IGI37_003193 [Enterococcus sp. AZ194]|uniref:uroporphyrinogen-III synthase n=1 Tax=Enterococcus sp. AZ194 TaxID=2774629 RepID=UPI003F21B68C
MMNKPTLLLTRGAELNQADQQFFERFYQIRIVSLAEIIQLPLSEKALRELEDSEWLFFTSQAPVLSVLKHANKQSKIAVIGKKTAAKVQEAGFSVAFISPIETKEAMVVSWQQKYPQPTTLFYAKSQLADTYVEQQLNKKDTVYAQITYENCLPKEAKQALKDVTQDSGIQAVYLTSPSAWRRFYSIYEGEISDLQLLAIGPTTQRAIKEDGFHAMLKSQLA